MSKYTILVNNGEYGKGLFNSEKEALDGIKLRLPKDFPDISKADYVWLEDSDFNDFLEGFDYYSVLEIHI